MGGGEFQDLVGVWRTETEEHSRLKVQHLSGCQVPPSSLFSITAENQRFHREREAVTKTTVNDSWQLWSLLGLEDVDAPQGSPQGSAGFLHLSLILHGPPPLPSPPPHP